MVSPSRVMAINGGSSSIKFAVFALNGSLEQILDGKIEGLGQSESVFTLKGQCKTDSFSQRMSLSDRPAAVKMLVNWIENRFKRGELAAIGHRIVHGGPNYWEPQVDCTPMVRQA